MNRKKIRIFAVSLAVFAVIAGITAFFTSVDTVTNAFVASKLKIKVIEPHWNPDHPIVPEEKVEKDPYIENIDETSAYVFMEVTVPAGEYIIDNNDADKQDDDKGKSLGTKTAPLFKFINKDGKYQADYTAEQKTNSGWYLMSTTENKSGTKVKSYTYLYAYTGDNEGDTMAVLPSGGRTAKPLFDKVIFINAREGQGLEGSTQHINIKAYAIQNNYLKSPTETDTKAENVWQHLKS